MMKRVIGFTFGLVFLLSSSACDNSLDLLEQSPPVPVIYGLFDSSTDQQILSVTKTFVFGDEGGAEAAAATPDSIYYGAEELAITITNESNGRAVSPERFDAATEGITREMGPFPTTPNIAYRYSSSGLATNVGDELRLEVLRNDQPIASSSITVLPEYEFQQARPAPRSYSLTSDNETTLRWRIEQSERAELIEVLEVGFNFAYTETRDGASEDKVLYWPAAPNLSAEGGASTASLDLRNFYGFLRDQLEADPSVARTFRYIQLVITGGDENFAELRTLVDANRGITSTQELPNFSNVEGAIGLFGSVTQLVQAEGEGSLRNESFDALFGRNGDSFNVADLNFRP